MKNIKTFEEFLNESVNEGNEAFKGDFSIGGIEFKSAVVTNHGSDYGVYLFLKNPDYKKVKDAAKALSNIEKEFFGSKANPSGGYDQSGENISTGTYSKDDAIKFAKHILTVNESLNEGSMPDKFIGNDEIVYLEK